MSDTNMREEMRNVILGVGNLIPGPELPYEQLHEYYFNWAANAPFDCFPVALQILAEEDLSHQIYDDEEGWTYHLSCLFSEWYVREKRTFYELAVPYLAYTNNYLRKVLLWTMSGAPAPQGVGIFEDTISIIDQFDDEDLKDFLDGIYLYRNEEALNMLKEIAKRFRHNRRIMKCLGDNRFIEKLQRELKL
ncbi:MAG: hypothetical protein ACYC6A_11420 [Armatimonadota bacterium]